MTYTDDFSGLGLSEQMLEAVRHKGFETPTPIQRLAIPKLLTQQNDIIAQSQTGTGKTAAYGLPILQELSPGAGHVQAIVLVPTRELALQVTEEMLSYNKDRRLSIVPIYGGASMSEQLRRLSKGIDIVVGTPGRVLDHIRRGTLKLSGIRFLILDEADEMLNMGFIEDVEEIMSHTPEQRRVMLFSATMPDRIVKLSKGYMRDTEILKIEAKQLTADLTDQIYFEVRESDKFDALTRIIDVTPEFYGIVFSRTKIGVDELVNRLLESGYAAEGLHGDVSQAQREKILRKFKKKQANILVATDVAARGIDINNLTHVINLSLPQDSESYVHRIGRTGRAGNQGTAITFISSSELRQFGFLKRDIKVEIKKETLPSAQDVVAMKRNKIKDDLQEIVSGDNYADYGDMADELLAIYPPEIALSALLRLAFRGELDTNSYPEIRSFSVDRKGTARLFIAIGREDGYDVRKLVALLKRECGLKDKYINDIKLSENYSFVSVPFADAEHVVRKLNNIRKGGRPLAEIAKPDEGGRGKRGDVKDGGRPVRKKAEESEAPFSEGEPIEQRVKEREEKKAEAQHKKEIRQARESSDKGDRPARGKDTGSRSKDTASRGKAARDSAKYPSGDTLPGDRRKPAREASPSRSTSTKGRSAVKTSAKGPKPAKSNTPEESYFPNENTNQGFDWSIFETGDNRWDDRPRKKKQGRK